MALYKGKQVIGGGNGASAGGPTSTRTTTVTPGPVPVQQISPLTDPSFAKLFELIQGVTPTSLPGIEQLTQQGMDSPLMQAVLGPALQRLQAPQAAQRQQLTEATRAAGGLRGSTYGQDFNRLLQNQALQSNDLMSQVIQQVLGTLVSGQIQSQQNQMLPGRSLTELLRTIAPQMITGAPATTTTTSETGLAGGGGPTRAGGAGSGWESIPPSQSLATKMSGAGDPVLKPFSWELNRGGGGGASGGVNAPTASMRAPTPYTPYLDPLSGGYGGGITYNPLSGRYESAPESNLGTFTPAQGGPSYPAPTSEWNPVTGAYQGGYQAPDQYEESFF